MSNDSFKVKKSLTLTPQDLTLLVNPEAGDLACDINDSNKIKRYDSNSLSWSEVGAGGIGGVDILFSQDFESASLSSFTQTGLSLSQVTPLHGKVSALMTHQAGVSPTNDQKFKQVIAVDEKFRGQAMLLELNVKSTASAGNVTLNVYDETNAANIVASEQLTLSSDTGGIKVFSAFTIPVTCLSLSYTITALPEAGSPVTRIDDILCQLNNASLLETSVTVPNLTAWQGYTPTFQGFGTPSAVEFEWRQVGENVEVRGKLTSGTATAIEARISLPNGYTAAGTTLIPSLRVEGSYARGASSGSHGGLVLIEPSVTYFTFGPATTFGSTASISLSKALGTEMLSSSEAFSFFASVPCAGLSASSSTSIPLTQSGIVQEADSTIRLDTGNSYGSTYTVIRRFVNLVESVGSDVTYIDSPTLGASFTINTDGVYTIDYVDSFGTINSVFGITKNSTQLTTGISTVANSTVLSRATIGAAQTYSACSWTGLLVAGDVIRAHTGGAADATAQTRVHFVITKQGSLKQVSVNTNSKITIPTSELRFEGASARGSTDTAIVKFDTQAKIRGDAFSVVNTVENGTVVTMLKAGKLDVSATLNIGSAGNAWYITKNQSNLISTPSDSEALSRFLFATATGSNISTASWSGFLNAGDIIRVSSTVSPSVAGAAQFNLSFQEQEIQVSVSNTLPQFSESDTYAKLAGNAGQVMTVDVTNIPFITILDTTNGGWNGSQFTVSESGTYNFTGSAYTVAAITRYVDLYINGVFSKRVSDSVSTTVHLFHIQDYYSVGDIISFRFGGNGATLSNVSTYHYLNINKVGKPNVTGVDVTPFVNVPQPVSQSMFSQQASASATSTVSGSLTSDSGDSILSYSSSTGRYTALKRCTVQANYTSVAGGNVAPTPYIRKNGVEVASDIASATTGQRATASWTGVLSVGEYIDAYTVNTSSGAQYVSVSATATADTILTAPETFSTDTASLQYASSSTYTLSTLANAPVGTFITFTYATSTNTRTQTTTAPTQTTADMNTNGMLIYTRAYNAASTAALPAAFAVQIGKGLKGKSLDLYKSAGKVTAGGLDSIVSGASENGAVYKDYNEITGILLIDSGVRVNTANTVHSLTFSDVSSQTSGYLVVNASKNPALTGLGLGTVAARGVNTAGTSIANTGETTVVYDAAKTYDTHGALNAATGVFTCPESGYYQASWTAMFADVTYAIGNTIYTILQKNGAAYAFGNVNEIEAATVQVIAVTGSTGLYLVKGDTVNLTVGNTRTAGATLLRTTVGANHFSIHKTSIGTGN